MGIVDVVGMGGRARGRVVEGMWWWPWPGWQSTKRNVRRWAITFIRSAASVLVHAATRVHASTPMLGVAQAQLCCLRNDVHWEFGRGHDGEGAPHRHMRRPVFLSARPIEVIASMHVCMHACGRGCT